MKEIYTTDVLIVGGGVGGTAAAIQAARRGANTMIVSEFPWLGGMLTSAGVCAPDGNELQAFQTGLWGSFLQELRQRQPGGLDNCWASFFSFQPHIGAEIFTDWVKELPNLQWISGKVPIEVIRKGDRIASIRFEDFIVNAKIILDGTELGDLLELAEVPYRWGWELKSEWGEPSAPNVFNELTTKYPVQTPTWVVIMQDFGEDIASEIPPAPNYDPSLFTGAWENHGVEKFFNYGRLPGNWFMINWPICGNDYGLNLSRLLESKIARREFHQECFWHSQNFAHYIQAHLGRRYGLAQGVFPSLSPAFALHPYYRESRRLEGLITVSEQDILPSSDGQVAAIFDDSVAIGNYANDHHYPGVKFPLQPKSIRWGGRWTGTPFTIPYRCLIPKSTDGLLVCEKNISVSHIANGATRLQPVVMGIGQAAGMAAALCCELNCQPRDLPIKRLQMALLTDERLPSAARSARSPAAIIPLFNLPIDHPEWLDRQIEFLDHPETYPVSGNCPDLSQVSCDYWNLDNFIGIFNRLQEQDYRFTITNPTHLWPKTWQIVTLRSSIDEQLRQLSQDQKLAIRGHLNLSGNWLLVEHIEQVSN